MKPIEIYRSTQLQSALYHLRARTLLLIFTVLGAVAFSTQAVLILIPISISAFAALACEAQSIILHRRATRAYNAAILDQIKKLLNKPQKQNGPITRSIRG